MNPRATSEPATVKVKPSSATTWQDARLLSENRFEADLDLASGPSQLNIQAKDSSNNLATYTYGLNLAVAAPATPQFDADGNQLSDGVRSYQWDSQSRLIKIIWGAGSNKTTEFKYNAFGQRSEQLEKTAATETARYYYLYEGTQLLCRYTGGTSAANVDRRYLLQGEQRKVGSLWTSYYTTRDHLGSIREVVNGDGSLAARYDYDPYGKRRSQYESAAYSGGCDFGFTGHVTLASPVAGQSELVLTLYRAYDPQLGRWLSADPLEKITGQMAETLPEGSNLYGYVGGNPVNAVDKLGLDVCYLLDDGNTAAAWQGHAASLIGDDTNGWAFLSFSPFGVDLARYSTFADAQKAQTGKYDRYLTFPSTRAQDKAAIKAYLKAAKRGYKPTSNMCGQVAGEASQAAFPSFKIDSFSPTQIYKNNYWDAPWPGRGKF